MTNIELPQQPENSKTDEILQQAIAYQQVGEFQKAGELYLTILQTEPKHPQANHNMGVLAVQMKQPAASLSYFVTALDADPTRGQYWLNYIDALFQAGQLDDARQVLALARQQGLQGNEVEALGKRIEGKADDTELTDTRLPPAQKEDPSNQQDIRSKSYNANKLAPKQSVRKVGNPSQQDINTLITLFASGRLQEAAPIAQAMTERFPQHEFGWKALGAIFKKLGRNLEALAAMQKAATLSPEDIEAQYNLGVTQQELGNLHEAESSYRRALEINKNYAPAHINLGVTLQKLDRLPEAETHYRRALAINPGNTKALSNLGVVLQRLGRPDEAEVSHKQALQLTPDNAETHVNLGNLLNEQHRDEEAERHFQKALDIDPEYADAHYNLANMLHRLGKLEEAEIHYQKTLQIRPDFANAHYNLGNLYTEMDRLQDAEASFRRALECQPDFADANFNLANLLIEQSHYAEAEQCYRQVLNDHPQDCKAHDKLGELFSLQSHSTEAEQCFRRVLEISPDDAEVHCKLGNELYKQRRLGEAGVCYWNAIKISPDSANAYCNLGALLIEWGRYDEAEEALMHALKSDPENPTTLFNLGNLYLRKGQLIESEAYLEHAIELKPDYLDAQSTLANTLLDMGRLAEAQVKYRKVLAANPENSNVHSNLLFCLLHDETVEAAHTFSEHRHFGEKYKAKSEESVPAHQNSREPERCLNIGFVSGDFRNHAVAFFIEPILAHLANYPQLSLHAYSNSRIEDNVTERMHGYFPHWHSVSSLDNNALAEKIRADHIDILIDLAGHSAFNRLLTFALKPAPIQASWIGYPGTTGLSTVDYYLADRFLLPEGRFDDQFTEQIVRLPANTPFMPFEGAPPVSELPALKNGYMTFASFNRMSKITRSTIALWGQLLRVVPDSIMLLGAMPLNERHEKLIEWFAQEDIPLERLRFHDRCDLPTYLALHQQADLCLDTFPYNGGTTTQHALWMGVPTLTLPGNGMPGRVGAAIMSRIGMEEFVAESAEDFVDKGAYWAANTAKLAELRTSLREHLSQSPLRKPEVIAAGLARALRIMWQRWCADLPASSFEVTLNELEENKQKAIK